jgi:hypothetical protein
VYRFSVIPGGAYSSKELARARRVDTVVRTHYAGFGELVSSHRMQSDTYLYVSYRKADRVFWSVKKHRIPKGELVLTDGKHLARARCGNRLSITPQQPTLPDKPMPEETLDELEAPQNIALATPPPPVFDTEYDVAPPPFAAQPVAPPAFASGGSNLPAAVPAGMNNLLSAYPFNPGFLYPVGGAAPKSSSSTTGSSGGVPAGVVIPGIIVPEPRSAGMFFAGLVSMLVFAVGRKRALR